MAEDITLSRNPPESETTLIIINFPVSLALSAVLTDARAAATQHIGAHVFSHRNTTLPRL